MVWLDLRGNSLSFSPSFDTMHVLTVVVIWLYAMAKGFPLLLL